MVPNLLSSLVLGCNAIFPLEPAPRPPRSTFATATAQGGGVANAASPLQLEPAQPVAMPPETQGASFGFGSDNQGETLENHGKSREKWSPYK